MLGFALHVVDQTQTLLQSVRYLVRFYGAKHSPLHFENRASLHAGALLAAFLRGERLSIEPDVSVTS